MLLPRILSRLHRTLLPADQNGRSGGLAARLYSWPPKALDPARDLSRDTAWLDGLRGVAAFLVMVYHYNLNFWGIVLEAPYGAVKDQQWDLWRLPFARVFMCAGHVQVSIFFILSGFVLSWSSLGSIRRGRPEKLGATLASSAFRRWLRLFLPCFAIGLISLFEMWFGVLGPPGGELKSNFFLQLWDYVKACERFADPFWVERHEMLYRHEYNWTMWTIPREYFGSLMIFLVVLSVSRIQDYGRRTIIIASAVLYAFLKARWDYFLFLYGLLLADYVQEFGFLDTTRPQRRFLWLAIMVASLYMGGIPEKSTFYPDTGYEWLDGLTPTAWAEVEGGRRFWWCWAGIMFVTSCCHLEWTRHTFASSITRYLGRVSYMLYVTHRPVWEIFGQHFKILVSSMVMRKEWSEDWKAYLYKGNALSTFAVWVCCWAVVGSLAILVGHWCEVLVDAPSVRLAKQVDQGFINGFGSQLKSKPERETTTQTHTQLPS